MCSQDEIAQCAAELAKANSPRLAQTRVSSSAAAAAPGWSRAAVDLVLNRRDGDNGDDVTVGVNLDIVVFQM